jgi:plastocyanin
MRRPKQSTRTVTTALLLAMLVEACGGGSTPPAEPPGSQAYQAPSPSPAPSASGSPGPSGLQASPSGNAFVLIATDNKFTPASYNVRANTTYSITMTNKGEALHNWRINDSKTEDGKDIAINLIEGGKSGSTTFMLSKQGTYHFICDVHPDEMKGSLTVN